MDQECSDISPTDRQLITTINGMQNCALMNTRLERQVQVSSVTQVVNI